MPAVLTVLFGVRTYVTVRLVWLIAVPLMDFLIFGGSFGLEGVELFCRLEAGLLPPPPLLLALPPLLFPPPPPF